MAELRGAISWYCRRGEFDKAEQSLDEMEASPRERSHARGALAQALLEAGEPDRSRGVIAKAPHDEPPNDALDGTALKLAQARGDAPVVLELSVRLFVRTPTDPDRTSAYAAALRAAGRAGDAKRIEAIGAAHIAEAIDRLPVWSESGRDGDTGSALYLDLLERTVCNWIYADETIYMKQTASVLVPYNEEQRELGSSVPRYGHSMIGRRRLRHLRWVVEDILARDVPGDLIEAGVWRGGACILMRGVLKAHDIENRRVFVADSFEGLPPPDPRYAADALTEFDFHLLPDLAVDLDTVRGNFDRYGLLDDQVVFVKGFFNETLPHLGDEVFAVLRLDGDLYSSTMDTLEALYDRVSPGGYVIVDDYGVVIDSRRAIIDFRHDRGITAPLVNVDGTAVYWKKD